MRTIIDLPQSQIEALAALSARDGLSRAELIRRAVASFLEENPAEPETAFGLWSERVEDGVAYQQRMRAEWDRP